MMLRRLVTRSLLTVFCLLPALLACRTSGAAGPDPDGCGVTADTLLTLCVGREVLAPDGVMRVVLLAVRNDSRCPVDAMCVWQGNAEVQIGIAFGMGPTVPYVLNTGLDPRAVVLGTYQLTLTDLRPVPLSYRSIPQDQYVATVRFARPPLPD